MSSCGAYAPSGTRARAADSLRGEVAPHGVKVVVFMPSQTDTEAGKSTRFEGLAGIFPAWAERPMRKTTKHALALPPGGLADPEGARPRPGATDLG